jgi:UDP-N-acetylmuramoyl-tripeptide--D-alanyl-D-alanine ligase
MAPATLYIKNIHKKSLNSSTIFYDIGKNDQAIFSRFSFTYDRSLLYMLQASEYNLGDFFAWYRRVDDFREVEKRKHLVWTFKIYLLDAAAYTILLPLVGIGTLYTTDSFFKLIVTIAILISIYALALPYVLALCVLLLNILQRPVEAFLTSRVRKILSQHKAIKIAVAGSYGKTSMREILKTILSAEKKVAAPGGSENTPIGIARFVNRLKGNEDVLIFELGEYYPGDIKKLCEMVQPDWGIITGVNEAHLSKFKTVEAAADTIFELADYLGDKPLYINAESGHLRQREGAQYYSRDGIAEWNVLAPETSLDGTSFVLEHGNQRVQAQTKLLGLHQIGPLCAAVYIALNLGLSPKQIEEGITKTKPFSHRLERRDDSGGVITLDDSYNGNPDGVKAVIDFLASIESHRRWYVTPGLVEMGDKSEQIHKDIGRQLAEANIEKVVLIKNSVTPWIEKGLKENSYGGDIVWFDDALKCYEQLPYMTVAGDVVLLQNDWPDQYA